MAKNILPDSLNEIIKEVRQKQFEEDIKEAKELVEQIRTDRANSLDYWDVKKEDKTAISLRS